MMRTSRVVYLGSDGPYAAIEEAAAAVQMAVQRAAARPVLEDVLAGGECMGAVLEPCPDLDPQEFLKIVRAAPSPVMPILVGDMRASGVSRLVRAGIYHCAGTDTAADEWADILESAAAEVRARLVAAPQPASWRDMIVGTSPSMDDLARIIALVAPRRCTVLITGESGTGKEVVARAIHMASDRCSQPLVPLNCSAIPEHLLEAELFGHTRGAFTGAASLRIGRFEQAHNSTLLLDEVGDMPLDLQAKLLRVLQEREVQRLGSSESIKVNVRVIAATNLDLSERVRQGKFREDLFHRLNVVAIQMPPLRERSQDISLLAHHFIRKVCRLEGIPPKELYNDTLQHLASYSWPGNVRELENLVEKAIVMSGSRQVLTPADFVLPDDAQGRLVPLSIDGLMVPDDGLDFTAMVETFERSIVSQALHKANGNKTHAADLLRLKRTTLISKLQALSPR